MASIWERYLALRRRHKVTRYGFPFMGMLMDPSYLHDVLSALCLGKENLPVVRSHVRAVLLSQRPSSSKIGRSRMA